MVHSVLPYAVVLGSGILSSVVSAGDPRLYFNDVCQQIAASTSSASTVYGVSSSFSEFTPPTQMPLTIPSNYEENIKHWASSSTQPSACSFEPGTVEDIGKALQILGKSRTPFAVKGGGHTTNPGFSSTPGVQISMTKFSEVSYDAAAQTATVGAGLIWDDVYAALDPFDVNVIGGRVSGTGVAGFTLGGGYSWLTNQHGLAIDNVQMFELVLPSGTAVNVTESTSPDLFFALKGGHNNFGIVTRFTLKTFPQTQVWGGAIVYAGDVLDQVNRAVANFTANSNDPKAAIITSSNHMFGQASVIQLVFYDGPSPPAGLFDEFLAIPSFKQDVSARSFLSLVKSFSSSTVSEFRVIFNTISVTDYPLSLLESITDEMFYWAKNFQDQPVGIGYDMAPFSPTFLNHNTTSSAYPASRDRGYMPLNIRFSWFSPELDEDLQNAARTSASRLKAQAIKASASDVANSPLYPNYAIFDTPLVDLYGDNLPRLQAIKAVVDPDNVMGLAGGFKL